MFKNLLTLMYRQFNANKLYSIIKISCLAVGMGVSLLILLYVFHEFSYDSFHVNRNSIYQMVTNMKSRDNFSKSCISTAGIGPSLLREFTEIKNMTRVSGPSDQFFVAYNKSLVVDNLIFVDSSFLNIFSFNLLSGNPDFALSDPFTMLVTPETGKLFFGDENPVGKVLRYQDKYNFKITGVIENCPSNSHILYNAILSFASLYKMDGFNLGWDGGWNYYTYVLAGSQISTQSFKEKLMPFLDENINNKYRNYGAELSLDFDPLSKVYLHSQAPETLPKSGNTQNLLVFAALAFFILLIACINYINLSTAQVSKRTRETGIKKVLGATRGMLIRQFLFETIFLSFVALILSVVIAESLLPGFINLLGTNISISGNSMIAVAGSLVLIGLLTGILAGVYPAIFLSGFSPMRVLKGGAIGIRKGKSFRNILVVLQFFLAGGLIICTMVVYTQISFINKKNLGYEKANYMIISLTGEKSMTAYELLKNKLKTIPQVLALGAATAIPGHGLTSNGYIPEGQTESMMFYIMDVDADFLTTLGIKTIQGIEFSDEVKSSGDIMVNEAFMKQMGWNNPVGKYLSRNGKHQIIGVVRDFHFAPLHHAIEPLIITNRPWDGYQTGFNYLVLKYSDIAGIVISEAENIWKELFPTEPFIFDFMDRLQKSVYADERNFSRIFTWASFFAIFIAGLGLYGLTTFTTQMRRKEIGIRKTFGAESAKIVILLGKQFIMLVVFGNILAWPFAWIIMERWLENFAFRASDNWWIYLVTLLISAIFAFATVVWHSIKAAKQNPVDALRYE
ncbi:MAG: ABC transporter permease [Bacteroidales bacterium]|nr:ABC transporter permease [Bacteroidales bacterium]